MKTRHLLILLLTFVLILYATPTIHAAGPPDPPDHADTIKPPPFDLGDEPIESQDGPAGVPGDSSISPGTPSVAIWLVETVDGEGYVGRYTSLALDNNSFPHIAYYGNGDLNYAVGREPIGGALFSSATAQRLNAFTTQRRKFQ